MAWIYLAESEDSQSLWMGSHILSPIVKAIPTAKLCYCPECGMGYFNRHPSGTTLPPYPKIYCPETSTSLRQDSPVRIFLLRELNKVWLESEADFILNSKDLLAKFDPNGFFWKMSQLSLFTGLSKLPWTSLRWGMIRDGQLFQPKKLEPSISVKGGSCLPTPTACDYGKNVGRKTQTNPHPRERWSLTIRASRGELPHHPKGLLNPEWIEMAMGYPIKWTETKHLEILLFLRRRAKLLVN